MTPEILNRIAQFRAKAIDGTITLSEMREGIILLREDRQNAASAARASKRVSTKSSRSAEDILSGLDAL